MNENDKKEFAELMLGLADNFREELSKPGLSMRFEGLKQFSIEDVKKAAIAIFNTRKYKSMPTHAEFLEHLGVKQISSSSKAEIQADVVLKVLKYQGRNASPVFDDPITAHLMLTRWRYKAWAATAIEGELHWFVKEFKEAYQAYEESGGVPMIEGSEKVKQLVEGIGGDDEKS